MSLIRAAVPETLLHGMVTMMGLACQSAAEDNLKQAAVALGYCETIALNL
ncbi:hypothetical protein [Streptomyces sp. NPDC056921]